jgi:fructose-1,6-bisphosphatase
MFPNPQDALPLPRQPNLEQYKKLAKELIKACKSGEPDAIRDWASRWVGALVKSAGLRMTPGLPA